MFQRLLKFLCFYAKGIYDFKAMLKMYFCDKIEQNVLTIKENL